MTADRFGAIANGEYTALASVRDDRSHRLEQSSSDVDPGSTPPSNPSGWCTGTPRRGGDDLGVGVRSTGLSGRSCPRSTAPGLPHRAGPVRFRSRWATPAGWLFLAAWVCASPVGYYLAGGSPLACGAGPGPDWPGVSVRVLPWAVITGALGLPLLLTRPWLTAAAFLLGVLWALGLWVAARRGERSLANDLLLVAQATVALPLAVAVGAGPAAVLGDLAGPVLPATLIVAGYLAGSVLHVKSLLREAGGPAFRRADITWHLALAIGAAVASVWWLVGLAPALARASRS